MKVVIIGAGISGVMTAYFLSRSGCQVTVIEREAGPADSTSFGNGGVLGGTQVDPWAQPGLPLKLLKWIGRENAPVLVRLGQIPKVMNWGLRFLARCNEVAVREAVATNVRLTLFSLARFAELREREGMTGGEYDLSQRGAYKLYFSDDAFAHARESADMLAPLGVEVEAIDPATAVEREPALAPIAGKLTGVLAFPREEVGDCRKFTRWMAVRLAEAGVDFRFGIEVKALSREGGRIVAAIRAKATSPPMLSWWRWPAARLSCSSRSASMYRSFRSRALA